MHKTISNKTNIKMVLIYTFLVFFLIVSLFPVIWTFLTSIKEPIESFAIPPAFIFKPSLKSYKIAIFGGEVMGKINFLHHAKNSIIISAITTTIALFVGVLAAYSLSRFKFKYKNIIGILIISTRMLPPIGTIIPMFLLMNQLNLLDTRLALILAYTALNVPFATWMLRGFIGDVPKEIEEAAMIDGCSRFQILRKILIPLLKPGLAATSVFTFLLSWNDFALAVVLSHRSATTLPLIINSFVTEEGIAWGAISAASMLTIIPAIIFVSLTHKAIMRGLTFGAVKG